MSTLQNAWQDAAAQWRANARLRSIAFLAAAILIVGVYLKLAEWRDNQLAEAESTYQQLLSTRNVGEGVDWGQRQKTAADQLALVKADIWSASTSGAAQALLRDVLARSGRENGLDLERLAITTENLKELGLVEVRAEFRGDYRPGQWQSFVKDLLSLDPPLKFDFEQINRGGARESDMENGRVSPVRDTTGEFMRPLTAVSLLIGVPLVLNAAWFFAYAPAFSGENPDAGADQWQMPEPGVAPVPQLGDRLIQSGAFGKPEASAVTEKEPDVPALNESSDQAREKLLGRLQGVVIDEKRRRAIFDPASGKVEDAVVSLQEGDQVPGTEWRVKSILQDRVSLASVRANNPDDDGAEVIDLLLYQITGKSPGESTSN